MLELFSDGGDYAYTGQIPQKEKIEIIMVIVLVFGFFIGVLYLGNNYNSTISKEVEAIPCDDLAEQIQYWRSQGSGLIFREMAEEEMKLRCSR